MYKVATQDACTLMKDTEKIKGLSVTEMQKVLSFNDKIKTLLSKMLESVKVPLSFMSYTYMIRKSWIQILRRINKSFLQLHQVLVIKCNK